MNQIFKKYEFYEKMINKKLSLKQKKDLLKKDILNIQLSTIKKILSRFNCYTTIQYGNKLYNVNSIKDLIFYYGIKKTLLMFGFTYQIIPMNSEQFEYFKAISSIENNNTEYLMPYFVDNDKNSKLISIKMDINYHPQFKNIQSKATEFYNNNYALLTLGEEIGNIYD